MSVSDPRISSLLIYLDLEITTLLDHLFLLEGRLVFYQLLLVPADVCDCVRPLLSEYRQGFLSESASARSEKVAHHSTRPLRGKGGELVLRLLQFRLQLGLSLCVLAQSFLEGGQLLLRTSASSDCFLQKSVFERFEKQYAVYLSDFCQVHTLFYNFLLVEFVSQLLDLFFGPSDSASDFGQLPLTCQRSACVS